MDKLCCCLEPDLPDISVNVTCACCESRVEEHSVKDVTDSVDGEEKLEKVDEKEDKVCCCCFRRKRHAKSKNDKKSSHNGGQT